jgi:hypothetical protein
LLWALAAALVCLAMPAAAVAEEPCTAPFDGLMIFPAIQGAEGPEDYCWEVKLGEEEELRQIDETHAGVFWEDGTQAMLITATLAHDAEGSIVPTTLAVTGPNLITLTVHHRAGDPAGGGAPFDYPVVAGAGWEGGFQTTEAQGPPPTEQAATPSASPPTPLCEVPSLQGRTVPAARHALRRAGCGLGPVRGQRRPGARIVKQYRSVGKTLPAGTEVGVKLAR